MLCITIAAADKFVNVLDGKVIDSSKHVDYALFHHKAHDVKVLKVAIEKFIYVDAAGEVKEVIKADQLKARGTNFKTAIRDKDELTEEEQAEVAVAIALVKAATPEAPAQEPAAPVQQEPEAPAAEAPTAQEPEAQPEGDPSVILDAEAPDDEPDDQPTDPLDTLKPSRKQKRR